MSLMRSKTLQAKSAHAQERSAAGPKGAALTPPRYGIDFVDRQVERENKTGLPDPLKAGIENLSGLAMDDVRVYYHSSKPAALQALAYTQGTDIFMGSGQERHLPHEAWHVVQQKEGRVTATGRLKGKPVNDEASLEREAGVMGELARTASAMDRHHPEHPVTKKKEARVEPVQRLIGFDIAGLGIGMGGTPFFRGTTIAGVMRRPNFVGPVAAPVPAGQARCHRVPFEHLAETLANHLNEIYRSEAVAAGAPVGGAPLPAWWAGAVAAALPPAAAQARMAATTDSFYSTPGGPPGGPGLAAMQASRVAVQASITAVVNKLAPTLPERQTMADNATNLERLINSSPANVRPGNATMNSRIAENLDLDYAGVGALPAPGGAALPGGFPQPAPWGLAVAWGSMQGGAPPLAVGANYLYATPLSNTLAYNFIMEYGSQYTARDITIVRNDDPYNLVPGWLPDAPLSSTGLPLWPGGVLGNIPVLLFDPAGAQIPLRFG